MSFSHLAKKEKATDFLSSKEWEKKYGEKYEKWRKSRWVDSPSETQKFLNHLLPLGHLEGEKRLFPHQAEAVQRAIYCHEHTDLSPILVTLATGTGKTLVMATLISYLRCVGGVDTFVLFCPNTIVRDRLKRDFEGNAVFKEFNLFPSSEKEKLQTLKCSVVEKFENFSNLKGFNVLVANRHQFQKGYNGGNDHLTFLFKEGGDLALFNDEAHNTRGTEYTRMLKQLEGKTKFRLDLTATPDRADEKRPESHEIYELSVVEAITGNYKHNSFINKEYTNYPKLIKDILVQRPDPKSLKLGGVTFEDFKSKKEFEVREINWEEFPRKKNLQLVMDPGAMKMQLKLSVEALNKKKDIAKGRYKPLLFVIAPSVVGAEKAVDMMKRDFNLNPLLVVGEGTNFDKFDKEELRDEAAKLGTEESPYDSVVSVYMLREGWDVPEVSVITFLRGFGSPLFAHQVLGRGLRLIRKNDLLKDNSVQELTVIDHPALNLDHLWNELDALVFEGDKLLRGREFPRDGTEEIQFEGKESFVEQKMVREDLYKLLLPIPDKKSTQSVTIQRGLEFLEDGLKAMKDYKSEDMVIVRSETNSLEQFRPNRKQEVREKKLVVEAFPRDDISKERNKKHITDFLMKWSEEISGNYSPFTIYTGLVYKTLLQGIEKHLCDGNHITSVNPNKLGIILHTLPTLKEIVTFEFNRRIYSEENLNG